jgi:hypothetical protein
MSKTRWLILLVAFLGCWSAASAQDVVLVANKGVQISEINAADLRAIFVGAKTRFADGSHAVPVTLKGGAAHEVFLKNHLGESPGDFRAQGRIYRTGRHAQGIRFRIGPHRIRSRHSRRGRVCEPNFAARQCEVSRRSQIAPGPAA